MTKDRPIDRRVQRTRRALSEALHGLMAEKIWDEISVQDICERADIGRSTFYMHFSSKEKLLVSGFEGLRRELRMRQVSAGHRGAGRLPFTHGLIEHAYENQRVFRGAIGKRSGYVVQRRFREMVASMVKEDLALLAVTGWRLDAAVHFIAGGFVELLTWWIDGRRPQQPADIEALFDDLSRPAIEQLRAMSAR